MSAPMDQALRDRLVAGLRSEVLQRQLLSEEDLTLKQAIQRAQAFEAAEANSKAPNAGSETTVQKVHVAAKSSPAVVPPCFHCGRDNHQSEECRFRNAKCHNCGRPGPISPVCKSRAAGEPRVVPDETTSPGSRKDRAQRGTSG